MSFILHFSERIIWKIQFPKNPWGNVDGSRNESKLTSPKPMMNQNPGFSSTWAHLPESQQAVTKTLIPPPGEEWGVPRSWEENKNIKKQTKREGISKKRTKLKLPFIVYQQALIFKLLIKIFRLQISFLCLILIIALALFKWAPKDVGKCNSKVDLFHGNCRETPWHLAIKCYFITSEDNVQN